MKPTLPLDELGSFTRNNK